MLKADLLVILKEKFQREAIDIRVLETRNGALVRYSSIPMQSISLHELAKDTDGAMDN